MSNSLFNDSRINPKWEDQLNTFISLVKKSIGSTVFYYAYRYNGCSIHVLQLNHGELELIIIEDAIIDIPDEKNINDMIRVGLITISTSDSVDSHHLIATLVGDSSLFFTHCN